MPRTNPSFPAPADASVAPLVRIGGGRRTLEFTPGEIQSEMLLARPHALVLAYSRAMMCFALFVPQPRHILMVGLGGGSLAKFCYRHFPRSRITVVELRADVIALRDQFCVPPDDARFRVVHADAADYIGAVPGSADVLIVDGFDARGLPAALGTARFYAGCHRALRPGGVLVANIFSYDPEFGALRERLRRAFGGKVCSLDGAAGNNRILFAVRAPGVAAAPRAHCACSACWRATPDCARACSTACWYAPWWPGSAGATRRPDPSGANFGVAPAKVIGNCAKL